MNPEIEVPPSKQWTFFQTRREATGVSRTRVVPTLDLSDCSLFTVNRTLCNSCYGMYGAVMSRSSDAIEFDRLRI